MKILLFILALSFALIIQSKVTIFGIPPSFTVIIPYYIGLRGGGRKGILAGSLVGMIEDSLSGNILGPYLLGKGIVGFSASLLSGGFFRWTPILGIIGLFSLTILDGLTVFLIKNLFNIQRIPTTRFITTVLFQGFLNAIVGVFLRPENGE